MDKIIKYSKISWWKAFLPTTNTVDLYRYSDELLKHIPDEELVTLENNLLYCKEKVILPAGQDRWANNVANRTDPPERTDPNLTKNYKTNWKTDVLIGLP